MDSSSDGSFAWTDASNDTIDSGTMVSNTMNRPNSEDESVSGKTFKKKLQEELFSQSNVVIQNETKLQHKERKRKLTEVHSENEHFESSKKRKIKREPESDIDASTRKHKTNGHNHSESHDSYDESYLKQKVKAEQQFATPSPIKTKRSKAGADSNNINKESFTTTNNKSNRRSKKESEETELEDDTLDQLVQEENENHERKTKKKKKSKKRKESILSEETQLQENNMEEDVAAEDGRMLPMQYAEELESNFTNVSQPDTLKRDIKTKNKKRLSKSSTGDPNDGRNEDTQSRKEQPVTPNNKSVTFNVHSESTKRTQSISERIQFEEDDSSDVDSSQLQSSKWPTKSSKLKTFLNDNSSLRPLTRKLETDSVLTDEDEIWIVRCPKDVDIDAFQNKDFTIEGKCKLKLNGQTYEGTVDSESENMSILSSEQSSFIIKSLPVKGYLSLRKRIPKSHIQDEAIHNNQSNFIPLPETKCRHPLFGSNYRKAIKLPASVAERLKVPGGHREQVPSSTYKKKKKNHKDRASPETSDHFVSTPKTEPSPKSVKPEIESDHTVSNKKKKKKRKHSDNEEIAPRKKKRIKHDLESAEAWESEQAIEENLFNF